MSERFDAIVIGAGEAGAIVASRAVGAGHRVAMIYREPYGSTCVNTGCVPSKFMIHRAHVAQVARTAGRFRVRTSAPTVDVAGIVEDKNALVRDHREEAMRRARAARLLTLFEGGGQFRARDEVEVAGRVINAEAIFVATGMRPAVPTIDGLERVPYLTNESLMDLDELPEHLVIVGGGYIACELGQTYSRYGTRVTIIQRPDRLCADEEPEVSAALADAFAEEGIALLLGRRATRVEGSKGAIAVTATSSDNGDVTIKGSHLLVAAGRSPNTDSLGLSEIGVETASDGSVVVDETMRTSVPGIWAIGDVNGKQPFTRVCQEEAKVAFADALEGRRTPIERLSLGHAIFTEPQIGSVGLTERSAREQGLEVATGLVTFDQVEKAEIVGETRGLIKYVVERRTRRLLGAHVIGPQAAELVYDAALVIRRQGKLDDIALTVGIFPTLQEGMEGTARGLLRRLEPSLVRGPLAVSPLHHLEGPTPGPLEIGDDGLACPACGADFDVTVEEEPHEEQPALGCPACGAEYATAGVGDRPSRAEADDREGGTR